MFISGLLFIYLLFTSFLLQRVSAFVSGDFSDYTHSQQFIVYHQRIPWCIFVILQPVSCTHVCVVSFSITTDVCPYFTSLLFTSWDLPVRYPLQQRPIKIAYTLSVSVLFRSQLGTISQLLTVLLIDHKTAGCRLTVMYTKLLWYVYIQFLTLWHFCICSVYICTAILFYTDAYFQIVHFTCIFHVCPLSACLNAYVHGTK